MNLSRRFAAILAVVFASLFVAQTAFAGGAGGTSVAVFRDTVKGRCVDTFATTALNEAGDLVGMARISAQKSSREGFCNKGWVRPKHALSVTFSLEKGYEQPDGSYVWVSCSYGSSANNIGKASEITAIFTWQQAPCGTGLYQITAQGWYYHQAGSAAGEVVSHPIYWKPQPKG